MSDYESPDSDTSANEGMIRFRCPQCTRAWKVRAQHAGKQFRCPACFMERTIPEKSVEETVGELYGVNETVRDTQEIIKEQSLISFRCRVCRAGLAEPVSQVGKRITCPDCDTDNVVPEPKPKESKEPAAPIAIYGVAGFGHGADLPPDDVFAVYCSVCNALLYARDDQIGTTLKCHDCDSDVFVHGRPKKPVKEEHVAKVYEGSSTYGLLAENQLPPDTQLVPVICSLCHTRMYATVDQIGQEKDCPDCGKMNLVKSVPPELLKTVSELFVPTDAYGVGEVTKRPTMRVNVDYRTVEGAVVERKPQPTDEMDIDPAEMAERIRENREKEAQRKKKKRKNRDDDAGDDELTAAEKLEARAKKRSQGIGVVTYRRPKLPKRPLTKGYWKLFAYMATHVHAIMAMLFFFLVAPLVVALIDQYSSSLYELAGGTKESIIIYLFMYLITSAFLFGGLCYLAQICLAVSMSTANGADEVEDWGGFSPFLALSSLICVGGAVAIGWAPVILWTAYHNITKTPGDVPGWMMPVCSVLSFFVYPVALMRLLEGFDRHIVRSNAIWSLRLIPSVWLRFYLLSLFCLIIPVLLIWQLFCNPNTSIKTYCSYGLAFFLPLCAICYFRLFGRLAWAVEVAVSKKREELEALAEEEGVMSDE